MMLTNISRDYFIEIQQTSFGTRTEKGKQTLQVGYFFSTGKQPKVYHPMNYITATYKKVL